MRFRLSTPSAFAQRRIWARLNRSQRSHSEHSTIRCVICHTRVGPEDAIGLHRDGIAHAECTLVQMLTQTPGRPPPERGPNINPCTLSTLVTRFLGR
jgi:hypothetical protein